MLAQDLRHLLDKLRAVVRLDDVQVGPEQFVPQTGIFVAQLAQWPPNLQLPKMFHILTQAGGSKAFSDVQLGRQR